MAADDETAERRIDRCTDRETHKYPTTSDSDRSFGRISRRDALKTGVITASALTLAGVATAGGTDDAEGDSPSGESSSDLVTAPFFVVDVNGARPWEATSPDTPLYDMRTWVASGERRPILTPDDDLVTWGEYGAATGEISVDCTDEGTHVSLTYEDLIPNGVYTVWNVVFEEPGFLGTLESLESNLIGLSPLGAPDASQNAFEASASGEGRVSATTPGGSPLYAPTPNEETGEPIRTERIADCVFDEYEWHAVAAYHLDDRTHGQLPGPAGTEVEQNAFVFKEDEPT